MASEASAPDRFAANAFRYDWTIQAAVTAFCCCLAAAATA